MSAGRSLDEDHRAGAAAAAELLRGRADRVELAARARALPRRPGIAATAGILAAKMATSQPDPAREAALAKLAAGAVACVTGQQPGLLGGPLLTGHKITTAIRLARWLDEQGIPAVAIFWNASEDHDLDEANRLFLQDRPDGNPRLFHLDLAEASGRSLDRIRCGDAAAAAIVAMFVAAGLPAPPTSTLPRGAETIGAWSGRLWTDWFHGTGLLVIEPHWLAPVSRGIKGELLTRAAALQSSFAAATAAVTARGYEARLPVPPADSTSLFWSTDRGRERIAVADDAFRFDGRIATRDELLDDAEGDERLLSTSVISRPILQQALLPSVVQVCGPSEVAYMAQVIPLMEELRVASPLIWPRASLMLLPSSVAEVRDRIDLDPDRLWSPASSWPPGVPIMPPTWTAMAEALDGFTNEWSGSPIADPELAIPSREFLRDLRRRTKDYRKLLLKTWRSRHQERARDRHVLAEALWPRGRPQERVYGPLALGVDARTLLHAVLEGIDPFSFERLTLIRPGEDDGN